MQMGLLDKALQSQKYKTPPEVTEAPAAEDGKKKTR
jgi:hypothetical protein